MSNPRPIHNLHRTLVSTPDEAEPSFSYEQESFLTGGREVDMEDDFHDRIAARSSRRDSSGAHSNTSNSFWRTSTSSTGTAATTTAAEGPSLQSVSLKKEKTENVKVRSSAPGLLGPALQSHFGGGIGSDVTNNDNAAGTTNNNRNGAREAWNERRDSSISLDSASGNNNNSIREGKKKNVKKQRAADRRHKLDALASEVEAGHIDDTSNSSNISVQLPDFSEMKHGTFLDRSSSDQSTGSLLYGKTPSSGTLLGKSSSLIFPTGVDSGNDGVDSESAKLKRRKINLALDQCEAVRFRFKKKLILSNMELSAADIPLKDLCGTSLGNSLHKLSLAGNRLGTVPPKLVQSLPVLKTLDLSQCELSQLPDRWNLPKLTSLNLSHNGFTEFPEESMLEGLPELQELNMYGNKVAEIIIPQDRPRILAKLEKLDLGYNDLVYLPAELDQLKSLKTLRVMNNFLNKIPMRVCEMDLKSIDVSSNPVTEPPAETCERGIASMRRYWQCIRLEEQTKQKALEEAQRKAQRHSKKQSAKKSKYEVPWNRLISKPKTSPVPPKRTTTGSSSDRAASLASSTSSTDVVPPVPMIGTSAVPPNAAMMVTPLSKRVDQGSGLSSSLTSQDSDATAKHDVERQDSTEVASVGFANSDPVSVNDTLKVIFVGMAMVGKTSMIKRLIEGEDAVVPTREERTVGVDIYQWDPKTDQRFEHIDSRIEFQDDELAKTCGDVDVKFSVWDFAGQHVYHATHELFFSPRALYVLVWDMGATNPATWKRGRSSMDKGVFSLSIESDDEEDEDDFEAEEEARRADRALERDIDEKVQFWVDCIQSSAPGAAILPVASFSDYFGKDGEAEAKRRCKILKQRLLKHEERRKMGIKERLKAYIDQNRADDLAAIRLRKLMCSYTRPKLIFGDTDNDSVVRVSGTQFTGFDVLTQRVISIATGRYKGQWRYPIFHGHVGARIPRMRLEVREEVRDMRDKFKVVEWGHFINKLRDRGLTNIEDISDALHFLTNTGELAYFGGVMTNSKPPDNPLKDGAANHMSHGSDGDPSRPEMMDEYVDDDQAVLSMDDTSITSPSTEDGSLTTVEDFMSSGLSEFVFLNPRWLVAAVACILRHDLDREIKETRRAAACGGDRTLSRAASFYEAHLNCPVITADDACLLWQGKRITKKAAKLAQEYSNNMTVTPFEFLQLLLIRFGVFVPIDLTIEKAFLGGKEYARDVDNEGNLGCSDNNLAPVEVAVVESGETASQAKFFFLPSLLGPCEPSDAWSFKTTESWKTTLCHSILFPDGVPPGLMERLTASVLSSMYAVTSRKDGIYSSNQRGQEMATYEGHMTVKEILCWRTAFYIKIGTLVPTKDGKKQESIVEIFTHLADRDSHLCVGSDYMSVGMRRLITSGRGQAGDGGRKIWKGGYLLVLKCIQRVMEAYGGLEFERQGFCTECLGKRAVSEASAWDLTTVREAVKNSEEYLRCRHGHRVDTRLVAGPQDKLQRLNSAEYNNDGVPDNEAIVPVQDLLRGVVVVGLWDGKTRKVVRVGSGFVADKKRGLIVTASHTLMNIWGDRKYPYGENYYGLPHGKVVVGIIPEKETNGANGKDMAVFRYFAKIVTKDASLDKGECHLDACVLRITTRMESDVGGNGDGCGEQPEILLLNDEKAMKREGLQSLKITEKSELDEQVRILGYNQGGEGLLQPGENLNRYVDFAKGYVCMKFAYEEQDNGGTAAATPNRPRFKPRDEIVVICPTIGGHSGGPCVNQQGEVIGILSRADPADSQRCYISPAYEWKSLVKAAKYKI